MVSAFKKVISNALIESHIIVTQIDFISFYRIFVTNLNKGDIQKVLFQRAAPDPRPQAQKH